MTVSTKPKTRTIKLNNQQNEILEILYKFRYATTELIVTYQELDSNRHTYDRLKLLLNKKYIGRHYDGHYMIHGKPAIYYLLPKGIRTLKEDRDLNTKAFNAMYKDGLRSEQFMERSLGIFKLYLKFKQLYGSILNFYGKSEITGNEYFYSPLPDAYIRLKTKGQETRHFILEVIEANVPMFKVRRRITRYINHFDSDDDPSLLLVCDNPLLASQTQRLAAKLLERADMDEKKAYTTTAKAVFDTQDRERLLFDESLNTL